MKRTVALLLSVLLIALAFGGCQEKKDLPTTTVFTEEGQVELPLVTMVTDVSWLSTNVQSVLRRVPGSDREFKVEVEPLPREEPDRSNRLTRMRTEMMAGNGPDLFVLDLVYSNMGHSLNTGELVEPLFAFPEKAMANKLFLPLDEYMENAQFTDFDRLMPILMELCRNEEGQQIIPLTYDCSVGIFDQNEFDVPMDRTGTREDMLDSGSIVLEYFAGFLPGEPLAYFGRDADFKEETLLITEEELLEQAMIWWEHWNSMHEDRFESLEAYLGSSGRPSSLHRAGMSELTFFREGNEAVAARNQDGGVTAYVQIMGAINRNANYPEYAFRVLDLLASEGLMREQTLYGWSGSMVSNMDVGSSDKPIDWVPMTEEGYEKFLELRGEITHAKFVTEMEQVVYETVYSPCVTEQLKDEAAVKAAVHKAYMTMKMMLAES